MAETALLWLRNDLRVSDNPALGVAIATGKPVVALYIEETDAGLRPLGGASRWWLHHSLKDLASTLARLGVPLEMVRGEAAESIREAISRHSATALFWNRRYAPAQCTIDAAIKAEAKSAGLTVESFAANVLVEPWTISTGQDKPYSVYTPFWKAVRGRDIPRPLSAPKPAGQTLELQPVDAGYREPEWSRKLGTHWQVGEAAAQEKLQDFLAESVVDYPDDRNIPSRDITSRLSPHLAFGEISPRQVWHAAEAFAQREPGATEAVQKFLMELTWRDFNYHQLYHRPDITTRAMQPRFADFPWREPGDDLGRWQQGRTGIPIVDAGMRELWETGFMHNRVRMIAASLLTKNLLVDWRLGEAWFWDCLLDADLANNPGNWQWVAGSGLDAAPYFRIFNPVTQGERFDPEGAYVRQWVPELKNLPDAMIHRPWEVGKRPGHGDYPAPIVDLKTSRERALSAFKSL